MYYYSYDRAALCLVGVLAGDTHRDEDFEALLKATLALDRDGQTAGAGTIHLLITEPGMPAPSFAWLWRLAQAGYEIKADAIFAQVSPRRLHRELLAFVVRLNPFVRARVGAFATVDEATRWVERLRGEHLPVVRRLLSEIRLAAGESPAWS
jgi:hypothetical protein